MKKRVGKKKGEMRDRTVGTETQRNFVWEKDKFRGNI